jgi:hypothetical protein
MALAQCYCLYPSGKQGAVNEVDTHKSQERGVARDSLLPSFTLIISVR